MDGTTEVLHTVWCVTGRWLTLGVLDGARDCVSGAEAGYGSEADLIWHGNTQVHQRVGHQHTFHRLFSGDLFGQNRLSVLQTHKREKGLMA